jgi:hypothetical protein
MKKLIVISLIAVFIIGILLAQGNYVMSWFVSERLVLQDDATTTGQSAELYIEAGTADQAEYIYGSVDGQIDLVAGTEVEVTATNYDMVTSTVTQGTGFWAGAPSLADNDASNYFFYFNDFIGDILFPTSTGAANGWQATGDATYDVLSAAGTLGGWCLLTAETGSNNEVYVQMGQLGTETFVECTSASGKEWWFEVNFTPVSVTNAANLFIGLADETAEAADFFNDSGADIADNDVIGFVIWEGDPNSFEAIYQTTGAAFAQPCSSAITAANVTAGIHFDGATTVTWYFNGSSIGTVAITATGFPDTEELSPLIGVKQGAADGGLNMDWIKLVAER